MSPMFSSSGVSPRRLVFEALHKLDMTIAEQLSIYTGLTIEQVSGILRQERRGWCDIVDYVLIHGTSQNGNRSTWETAVWKFTGPEPRI